MKRRREVCLGGEFCEFINRPAIDRAVFTSNHRFDAEVNFLLTPVNTCSCASRLEAKISFLGLGVSLDAH